MLDLILELHISNLQALIGCPELLDQGSQAVVVVPVALVIAPASRPVRP
jgi:hypothetical protein